MEAKRSIGATKEKPLPFSGLDNYDVIKTWHPTSSHAQEPNFHDERITKFMV